ncbi:heme peroxidase [Gonapodya prolifera JEL478]|uniref:Peroxidase n=1 Tax=Gonapodya prolifera (strain JEL478) TaxID=1344416 RepID=A0A139AHQ9_GONPJ|nr:heme peroxidase [Gonapodya prolifera JEL478]|eukprot:KXS16362.1 heme peroxidase [Gonapodya prolifera JEL478]
MPQTHDTCDLGQMKSPTPKHHAASPSCIGALVGLLISLSNASLPAPPSYPFPLWPGPHDVLEGYFYQMTGYRQTTTLFTDVSPDTSSPSGPGRNVAAERLRTAFLDMISHDAQARTGALDGSLLFETERAENVGAAVFNTTLDSFQSIFNARASLADLAVLGVAAAMSSCGGPVFPVRVGRVDALKAGPFPVF